MQIQNKILMEIKVSVVLRAVRIFTKAFMMKITTILCFLVLKTKKLEEDSGNR
jgi:hypothetical protein